MKKKFIIITTIPESLSFFKGQLGFLNQYFKVIAVSSGFDKLQAIAQEEEIAVKSISMQRNISFLKDLISLFCFVIYFYKEKPFIVHGNTPKASMLSLIAAFLLQVPHRIYMCHGLRYQSTSGIMRHLLKIMERITCCCATDIYAVSNGVASTLYNDKITKKKVSVMLGGSANGIDLDYYSFHSFFDLDELRHRCGINESDFVYIFLGRVVRDKGINELIEAFSKLSIKNDSIKLLIAGPKEDYNSITSNSTWELEHNPNIIYLGFQSDIRPLLALSDVLVLPSYREGLGMVLLEAGAMGVPCIVSDIIGCNDVIIENINGLLTNVKDVNSLFVAMERLLVDDELRNQIIQNTKASIVQRFEQKKIWNAFISSYLDMK